MGMSSHLETTEGPIRADRLHDALYVYESHTDRMSIRDAYLPGLDFSSISTMRSRYVPLAGIFVSSPRAYASLTVVVVVVAEQDGDS